MLIIQLFFFDNCPLPPKHLIVLCMGKHFEQALPSVYASSATLVKVYW